MENKSNRKKIVFLTGTRADFGKMKSLINIVEKSDLFDVYIFATGMHMNNMYGRTVDEIIKCDYKNVFMYYNHIDYYAMDSILSKTIDGFSNYVKDIQPDLIVIHGDRVETLAGAIVGALNNVLTAHIEGGELSGTIDECIRHSVSKLCHVHFVSNNEAKKRLLQMGEELNSIFVIGSPDVDIMLSKKLPTLEDVRKRYEIKFDNYAVIMFHAVTTEYDQISWQAENLVDSVIESGLNYIVIYPNNDKGSEFIFKMYSKFEGNTHIKIFPSMRFEYFLTLLKNASFIIGNSSSGIMEAPYYGVPTINIGTRQMNRNINADIINCGYPAKEITKSIQKALKMKVEKLKMYGVGESDKLFFKILSSKKIWSVNKQKQFRDLL